MRVVAWSIRAGGGRRVGAIGRQLERWGADVVGLSEFRVTPPGCALMSTLAAMGLRHQVTTAHRRQPSRNALLVAARWPLRRARLRNSPCEPGRWVVVEVAGPLPFVLGVMHVPNRVSGRKYPFLDAVLKCARRWPFGPALLVGDTNSGRRGIDEEVPAFSKREEGWIDGLASCVWRDAFRPLRAYARVYTWYSQNGRSGFRIAQAFVNGELRAPLKDAFYVGGGAARGRRRDLLSDHAALLLD